MKKAKFFVSIILLSLFLPFTYGGCNGGGGGGSTVPIHSIGGIWEGNFVSSPLNQSIPIIGLASEEDEAHFISNQGVHTFGTALVNGSSVSGTFDSIAPPGFLFLDGSTDGEVQVKGTIDERISFNGNYNGNGDNGSFNLTYNTLYDRDSELSLLEGQWLLSTINNVPVNILLTIQNDGTVTGNDLSGNTYNGNFLIIDPNYNMYQISISESDINNNVFLYTGLCALGDWMVINDILYFGAHSSNIIAIAGTFVKQ